MELKFRNRAWKIKKSTQKKKKRTFLPWSNSHAWLQNHDCWMQSIWDGLEQIYYNIKISPIFRSKFILHVENKRKERPIGRRFLLHPSLSQDLIPVIINRPAKERERTLKVTRSKMNAPLEIRLHSHRYGARNRPSEGRSEGERSVGVGGGGRNNFSSSWLGLQCHLLCSQPGN